MRKIGVVGPEQSINRIIEVGKAMEPAIEFISFAYADAHEAVDIVKRYPQS